MNLQQKTPVASGKLRIASYESQSALTLLELLVIVGIISILTALLMPSLKNARDAGKGAACLSNLRQIALALNLYANENDGGLPPLYGGSSPPESRWTWRLQPYGLKGRVIFCPLDPNLTLSSTLLDPDNRKNHSYILNAFSELAPQIGQSVSLWNLPNQSEIVLLSEKKPTVPGYYVEIPGEDPEQLLDQARHLGKANYLFADGHVRALPAGRSLTPNNLWTIDLLD